jgi:hypothetical protein
MSNQPPEFRSLSLRNLTITAAVYLVISAASLLFTCWIGISNWSKLPDTIGFYPHEASREKFLLNLTGGNLISFILQVWVSVQAPRKGLSNQKPILATEKYARVRHWLAQSGRCSYIAILSWAIALESMSKLESVLCKTEPAFSIFIFLGGFLALFITQLHVYLDIFFHRKR